MGSKLKKSLSRGLLFLGVILMAVTFAGCGSSGGDGGGEAAVQTGTFVDSIVIGLNYKTPTTSGLTDDKGTFEYKSGEVIQFFIGDILLGETTGKGVITPVDLVDGASDETHPQVINLIRFLQTLDDDNDTHNGILIAALVRDAAAGRSIDFSVSVSDFELDEEIKLLISELTESLESVRVLVTSRNAQGHFRDSLLELFEGLYRGTFSGDDSGTWEFNVSGQGFISGTFTSADGSSDAISGNVGSNGQTTISGVAGSSLFSGIFQRDGSVSGTWANQSEDESGNFSGERVVLAESESEGESTPSASGSLSLSGGDTAAIGTKFTPDQDANAVINDGAGLVQWRSSGDVIGEQVGKEFLITVNFSGDGTPIAVTIGIGTLEFLGSVSFTKSYGYVLTCGEFGVDCSGISVDISGKKITFFNVTVPEVEAALGNNFATDPLQLAGILGW